MYRRPSCPASPGRRRGAILIVVLALLAIFAVIAVTFVFYSSSEADAARIYKQAQSIGDIGSPDGSDAVNGFLGSLIFDRGDVGSGELTNVLRGHSLARAMYGWNSTSTTNSNLVPFNGVGMSHPPSPVAGISDRGMIANFTVINNMVIDPEWTGSRVVSAGPPAVNQLGTLPGTATGQSYIPKDAPYTYPDANNLYLASISPRTGEVVTPSFYRSWQFVNGGVYGTTNGGLEPTNPNWTNTQGRFLILRPRPQDNIFDSGDGRGPVSDFPYVPANADGTFTGDVQNLVGGYFFNGGSQFVARNDSIWLDIGLSPRMWNGKWIKPLVAPLVLDLDGRLNLSAHGNVRGNAGVHTSYAGYGPWEINLGLGLGNAGDANNLVLVRQGGSANAVPRNGVVTSRGYASFQSTSPPATGLRLPAYSEVNWNGNNGSLPQLPGFGASSYATAPTYISPGFDDNATNTAVQIGHPSLFNPAEWSTAVGASGPRAYASSDIKRLNLRFAAELSYYQQMDLANISSPPNTSLIGTGNAGQTYRLDPAHHNRLLVTPLSATLDLPGMMPGVVGAQLALNSSPTINPATNLFPVSSTGAYPTPPTSVPALGPVDLNRPLADYRANLSQPLSPTNLAPPPTGLTVTQAAIDRQLLARDIFVRLLTATGGGISSFVSGATDAPAKSTVGYTNGLINVITTFYKTSAGAIYQPGDFQITAGALNTPTQLNAVRYFAQLAANIVDYVDPDDINTTFVWNPMTPGTAATVLSDTTNFQAAQIGNSVVFGFEKPRLTISETYSEIANDPGESGNSPNMMPPGQPAHVRFWVELLNPTSTPYLNLPGGNTSPLGDGSVALQANGNYPFRLQVFQDPTGTVSPAMTQANNVTGYVASPQIQYNLVPSGGAAAFPNGGLVSPNNAQYGPKLTPANGAVVVGPTITAPGAGMGGPGPQPFEFNPVNQFAGQQPWTSMIQAPVPIPANTGASNNSMEYLIPSPGPTTAQLGDGTYKRHVVVLRRLANPYLPPADPNDGALAAGTVPNPYITVDYMDYVPSFDSMVRASTDTTARTQKAGSPPSGVGYDPPGYRFSVGKVQPYAGFAFANLPTVGGGNTTTLQMNAYSFPQSFVLPQNPNGFAQATSTTPATTFGQLNGRAITDPTYTAATSLPATTTETIMAPFDWLVHMDRPLANQLELLHVAGVKPYELTQRFVTAPGGAIANIRKDLAQAPWLGSISATGLPGYDTTVNQTNNQLFRALELLRVKPWGYGVPPGGKVHGRINVNTIQDQGVLQALFDVQAGNQFTAPAIGAGTWLATRTPTIGTKTLADGATQVPVPIPGPTIDDLVSGGTDRPFKPFGAGEVVSGTTAYGIQDTVLRINTGTAVPTAYAGQQFLPYLWNTGQPHPYFQAEAARKILNNMTTVSNTFFVAFTVGFFEVRTNAAGVPQTVQDAPGFNRSILGKEAYKDVPGDLRQQYVAIIDRNNLTVANPTVAPTATAIGPRPFFTTLEGPVAAGSTTIFITASGGTAASMTSAGSVQVFADGQAFTLGAGTNLVIGSGMDQESVTVAAASYNPATGIGTISLNTATPTKFAHGQGDMVSNVQTNGNANLVPIVPSLGNPGPQSGFDVVTNPTSGPYSQVVPYWIRVR